jgi:hypothetical protein
MWMEDGRLEPVDPRASQSEWIVAFLETAEKAGSLNRKAAWWTAVTVALSTLSTLIGAAG